MRLISREDRRGCFGKPVDVDRFAQRLGSPFGEIRRNDVLTRKTGSRAHHCGQVQVPGQKRPKTNVILEDAKSRRP
jgi:hypothetical protein